MIERLVVFGMGIIFGAILMIVILTIVIIRATMVKKSPTKDEWRHM